MSQASDPRVDPDDEALSWVGDESVSTSAPTTPTGHADGHLDLAAAPESPKQMSSVLLVLHGVIGGIYLLYTIGWLIAVIRDPFSRPTLLAEIMAQFGEFLAIVAPLVWMAVTVLLTRGRPGVRMGWLAAGVLLLVPVPFVLGG